MGRFGSVYTDQLKESRINNEAISVSGDRNEG